MNGRILRIPRSVTGASTVAKGKVTAKCSVTDLSQWPIGL